MGYIYINSDDGWLDLNRTAGGELNPSAHFLNNTLGGANYTLKTLATGLHAKGYKFGIYAAAGQWRLPPSALFFYKYISLDEGTTDGVRCTLLPPLMGTAHPLNVLARSAESYISQFMLMCGILMTHNDGRPDHMWTAGRHVVSTKCSHLLKND